jgi:alcohol dehydrogenase
MIGFDHTPRTRLVFGANAIERLGELARELAGTRALIVTDRGIVAAGHVERAESSLRGAGIKTFLYDRVRENPTTEDVEECLKSAREFRIDLFVGLGGGSSIDTARGCNFLLTNGGEMQDYWGIGKASKPMLPLIAAPTTAGTGSECQSFALIADAVTHQKMACGDPKAAARIAILDPTLTLTQPDAVTAHTGIDAIAHAVESFVTRRRNELSQLYARESFRLTIRHFARVLECPSDLEARAAMLLGAAYAGLAIENSMLGAAHSCANPLTAHYNVIHGQAVGMMLPHIIRFNAETPSVRNMYRELMISAGLVSPETRTEEEAETLARTLDSLLKQAKMMTRLRETGISASDVPMLAEEAARQWTAGFNPREITVRDFEQIYQRAM